MSKTFVRNTGKEIRRLCCVVELKLNSLQPENREEIDEALTFMRDLAEECRLLAW